MRAALAGTEVRIRNPASVRPWQHVLNPLGGYLVLAQALWASQEHARAWNFGPADEDARPVSWVVQRICELWPGEVDYVLDDGPNPPETQFLKLDSSRAREDLGWSPAVGLETALQATVEWYRRMRDGADMRAATLDQIETLCPPA
jgi:CDP-glucose 4,6-dehydratase